MVTHLEAVAGILVSILLFYFSYRQTIGASRERAQAANAEIDSVIFKRTVLEGLNLTPTALRQLAEGKALMHKVRASDLHSVEEILQILFATILESDFVPENKRASLLDAVVAIAETPEKEVAKEADAIAAETAEVRRKRTEWMLTVMVLIASVIGGLFSILPRLGKVPGTFLSSAGKPELYMLVIVSAASVVLLSLSVFILRLRESQEESARASELRSRGSIDREVLKIFHDFHIPTSIAGPDFAYDFDADIN